MITLILGEDEVDLEKLAALTGHDGWGMAPLVRFARRGAQQHGDSDVGYVLEPRFGTLVFRMRETRLVDMYAMRDRLLGLFAPGNDMKLRFSLPDGRVRQWDVVYAGDLGLPWGVDDWAAQQFSVTLKAPDPTCYDPVQKAVTFLAAPSTAWPVPWGVPWTIGDGSFDQAQDVTYDGLFASYPVIWATGPMRDLVVTNEETGDRLDFDGVLIPAGDVYTIDCRYGFKTVTNNAGVNKVADLTSDSDLDTFRIVAPVNGRRSRVNRLRVTGGDGNAVSRITISWYSRFLGA